MGERKDEMQVVARIRGFLNELELDRRGMSMEDVKRLRGVTLPSWVYGAVREVLSGYDERADCLRKHNRPDAVLSEYARLNRAVDVAMETVCFGYAESTATELRRDMIARRGYWQATVADVFGERTFYKAKKQCYLYMAANLGLI